jgi:hypothetical protein
MDEAEAVLERLRRIEALECSGAEAPELLEELRQLVREAEDWSALEGDSRSELAVDSCRTALRSGVAMSR